MMESRIYFDEKMVIRPRARVSYKQKLTNWLSLVTSEKLFRTKEFDHNRLSAGMQFKLKKTDIDL